MNHIFIFLHFISFATGIGLITLVYYFYSRYKSNIAKFIFFMDIFYTYVLLMDTLDLYFRKNLSYYPNSFHYALMILLFIGGIMGLYYFTLIAHHVLAIPLPNAKKKLFWWFSILVFVTVVLLDVYSIIAIDIADKFILFIFGILIIYNLLLICINMKSIKKEQKPLIIVCVVLALFSISYTFVTSIFKGLPLFFYKIPNLPVIYFCINAIGILYIKKYLATKDNNENKFDNYISIENNIKKDNFAQLEDSYGITERELEIIHLIVDGFSNQDIGKKLFISPNTVKNHVYSIYKKIRIKNRFELMSLLITKENINN